MNRKFLQLLFTTVIFPALVACCAMLEDSTVLQKPYFALVLWHTHFMSAWFIVGTTSQRHCTINISCCTSSAMAALACWTVAKMPPSITGTATTMLFCCITNKWWLELISPFAVAALQPCFLTLPASSKSYRCNFYQTCGQPHTV